FQMRLSVFFAMAKPSDVPDIHEFLLSDFLFSQSLNGAVGVTREDAHDRYLIFVEKTVATGTSVVVRNAEEEVVGVRLSGFSDRDEINEPVDFSTIPPRIRKIRKILTTLSDPKWDLVPSDIDRLFEIKLLSVAEKYRGLGIAKDLLTYGMDLVLERGVKGAFAEAIAIASQKLFNKHGYAVIREIAHDKWLDEDGKPVFVCPDGTKTVQLVFKRFEI
ncbi:hypothetical protein PENTCL1PPCAC_5196, partial [Pristionchus entomophagus]